MNERVKLWLIKAFEDYKVIKILTAQPKEKIPTAAICFPAQQFVEKMLKAYLTYHEVPFPKTHILEVLKQKCLEIDEVFQNLEFKNLSQYAVDLRYPDDFYIPEIEEAFDSVKIAEEIKNIILERLGLTEKEVIKWRMKK